MRNEQNRDREGAGDFGSAGIANSEWRMTNADRYRDRMSLTHSVKGEGSGCFR